MKSIIYADEQGNTIAEVFDDVPNDGEIVTLEHPLLGGRVDYVVTYHPRPPRRWYVDNGARPGGKDGRVQVTLMPVGKVTVTVREKEQAADPVPGQRATTTA